MKGCGSCNKNKETCVYNPFHLNKEEVIKILCIMDKNKRKELLMEIHSITEQEIEDYKKRK